MLHLRLNSTLAWFILKYENLRRVSTIHEAIDCPGFDCMRYTWITVSSKLLAIQLFGKVVLKRQGKFKIRRK